MEITPTTIAASSTSKAEAAAAATGAEGMAADFQTFLKLLTTQMRNQDPLKPTESTEFVAQLASFSGVEQQVRANDRLDGILAALGGGTSAGVAAWIGREVRAPVSAGFTGEPVEVGVTAADGADRLVLVVENDFGQVIARREVAADAATATWDGLDDLGAAAAHGRYSFAVESYAGSALTGTAPGTVYATVREVHLVDGTPRLVLEDGTQVALDDVSAVR
jgi:flagellar basal-body rod modification protein FlgD